MTPSSVDGAALAADKHGRAPAEAIQNDEAPLTRRKPVQMNEAPALPRQGMTERIDALRSEIRSLVTATAHMADAAMLDLMADTHGTYAQYKVAQGARSWVTTASLTLETGLMQLDRAVLDLAIHGED